MPWFCKVIVEEIVLGVDWSWSVGGFHRSDMATLKKGMELSCLAGYSTSLLLSLTRTK